MTAEKLFGTDPPPSVVSYARCSTKPRARSTGTGTGTGTEIDCFSYQQQHSSNRTWITAKCPSPFDVREYSEFGSAYQPNVVPPTLLGLLRHLRHATIVVAFADRLCRNIDNLRKIIAPLMRKNHIQIVVSGNGQLFDLSSNYETGLLKMTGYFAMYHEESAIKSERAKALHRFRTQQKETNRATKSASATKKSVTTESQPNSTKTTQSIIISGTSLQTNVDEGEANGHPQPAKEQIVKFIQMVREGKDFRLQLARIIAPKHRDYWVRMPWTKSRTEKWDNERIASVLQLCDVPNIVAENDYWTPEHVNQL